METQLAGALRERGQRVTPQRLVIARVMQQLDRHATAEMVFGEVSTQMPGVSLPTVYATLDLLEPRVGSVAVADRSLPDMGGGELGGSHAGPQADRLDELPGPLFLARAARAGVALDQFAERGGDGALH